MNLKIDVEDSISTIHYTDSMGNTKTKTVPTGAVEAMFRDVKGDGSGSSSTVEYYPENFSFKAVNHEKGKVLIGFTVPPHVGMMRFNRCCFNSWVEEHGIKLDGPKYAEKQYCQDPDTTRADVLSQGTNTNYRGEIFEVPMPGGLTMILLSKATDGTYSTVEFYQAALTTPFHGPDTMLYEWPSSNIFAPGMKVCIGINSITKIKDFSRLSYLPWIFYNGVHNNDLRDNRKFMWDNDYCRANKLHYPYELWRHLKTEEGKAPKVFPTEILSKVHTVRNFMMTAGFDCKSE